MKRFFKAIWSGWKKFAHALGVFNTKVLLTLMYFVVLGVSAAVIVVLRRDLIDSRFKKPGAWWHARQPYKPTLQDAKRQF